MEVSLLTGSNDIIKKPIHNSSHSPIKSRPGERVLVEQESDKCKHFTIRGYVSEVRERNAKNCGPFSMLNHTSDKHVNKLPPLPVKKFRRWACQSCLHKTIAPEAFIENGENITNQNDRVKNGHTSLLGDATKASHCETKKSLVRFPQQSEENCREGIAVQEDNSIHVSNDECRPSLCCGKKRDASATADLNKGGIIVCKCCYTRSKESQNLMCKSNVVATEQEACQAVEKEKGKITVTANTSDIALHSGDIPKILSCKRGRTALVHRTGGSRTSEEMLTSLRFTAALSDKQQDQGLKKLGIRKELDSHVAKAYRMPLGVDVAIPKDGALPAPLAHISRHVLKGLGESGDEASDTSIHLIENELHSQDDARKLDISVEKSCPKKTRKIRTLDDIMKSEKLQKDKKNCIPSENVGASGSFETPDTSKQKDDHPNRGCHLIQNIEATTVKRKNTKEAVANDGEGTSLIHWLKKVPKKASLHKGEEEAKFISTAASTSKVATVKGLDLNHEYSGRGENKQEIIGERKRNMMPEGEVMKSSFMPRSIAPKGLIITEDLQAKNSHSKSAGIIVSAKDRHHKIETHDNIRKKAPLSNQKSKRPRIEDGTSSQWCFKDSLGVEKQPVFQIHREVKKKQKIMWMSEQEAADDIPMEIVELLAKKQHERHLVNENYDSPNMSKLSDMAGSMKDGNGWGNTTGAYGTKVSDAVHRCLYQEEPQGSNTGYGAWTSVSNNGDAECRSKAYHSCSRPKQYHHFDLNQDAQVCASTELLAPSSYIGLSVSGAQLSIVDSNRNYSPQNLSTNGNMLAFCSDHMDQTVLPQNLFSNTHDRSCGLLNGYPPRINAQRVCSDFDSNTIFPGVYQKAVAHDTGYQMLVNPSKEKVESSTSGGTLAAKSFAESGNWFYSNMMGPVDLHNNESISALNLLWLIQQSACSGETCHSSAHNDNMWYIRAFNGNGSEFLGSEVYNNDPNMPSGAIGNCKLDKQPGNPCKPLRPLPRVGILGPLLQKEITNTPNNSTPALGFGARNPSELIFRNTSFIARQSNALASHKTIEKEKAEASPLAPVKVMNVQTSVPRLKGSERIDSSVVSLAYPGCSLANDNIGRVVTGSKDGAFQPLKSTCIMEECVVNRNPADFAMPDEDSEYMIGYQETKTKDVPLSGSLQPQAHLHNKKGQKMRKLNDLNRSRMSNKSSLSRLSCPQKAK